MDKHILRSVAQATHDALIAVGDPIERSIDEVVKEENDDLVKFALALIAQGWTPPVDKHDLADTHDHNIIPITAQYWLMASNDPNINAESKAFYLKEAWNHLVNHVYGLKKK